MARAVSQLKKPVKIELPYYTPGKPPYSFPWQTEIDYLDTLKTIWGEEWGAQGIGRLRRALVAYADESEACEEFASDPVYFGRQAGPPDIQKCVAEQENAFNLLKSEGVRLDYLKHPTINDTPWAGKLGPFGVPIKMLTSAGSAFVVHGGAIVPRRGISYKVGVEVLLTKRFGELGCPILYTITGKGTMEIGSSVWLDYEHWIVSSGTAESNSEAIEQVTPILQRSGVKEIMTTTVYGGSWGMTAWCRSPNWGHVTSAIEAVDVGTVLAIIPSLSYEFVGKLLHKGVNIIEAAPEDGDYLNVVILEPGKVMISTEKDRRPVGTLRALKKAGIDVLEVEWTNMGKLGGGIRCGVGPLVRDMPGPSISEVGQNEGKRIPIA